MKDKILSFLVDFIGITIVVILVGALIAYGIWFVSYCSQYWFKPFIETPYICISSSSNK